MMSHAMEVHHDFHYQYNLSNEYALHIGKQRLDQLEKLMYVKYQEWIKHLHEFSPVPVPDGLDLMVVAGKPVEGKSL